jgi:outer membrane receptor protein involved in Fe transport
MKKSWYLVGTAAWLALTPSMGMAQTASAEGENAANDIIVTGLKRDERFINAPVSVQVFTEEAITKAGVTRPQDFLNLTSNVTFIQTNHAGEAFVNIRGQASVRQAESAVAVVIDGVQGSAKRALRPQRHRRRDHHPHQGADQRA